jgi:UDP-2,3-diacylglucosamine pyrophosphatase LpxH
VFIAGNHDEMLRPYAGMTFGGIELALEAIHVTAPNRANEVLGDLTPA